MSLKIEQVTDCNELANSIMTDIADIENMERMLDLNLTSEELFKIDSAILASLRSTKDFSRDLLEKLENGKFEDFAIKPKSLEDEIQCIQQEAIMDITLPLQEMFDQMAGFIEEALA